MEKNKSKNKIKRSKTPDNTNRQDLQYEKLSEYIKLNAQSFQHFENKNFSLAKLYFSKIIEISKDLDGIKYIESIINYSLCLYFNNEILSAYNSLKNAKDISFAIINENNDEINQIYFIYLRVLGNMCLIALNLNKISESKELFKQIISLIKNPKITDNKIQIAILRELIYIFYRIDSLNKFQEINEENEKINSKNINNINPNIKFDEKTLYNLYKSLKNNDLDIWISFLTKELNQKNIKDINGYIWLLINKIIALYYLNENGNNNNTIQNDFNNLIKLMETYFDFDSDNIDINNNINKIIFNFKTKFNIAVQYYQQISNLEKDLEKKLNEQISKYKNPKEKENKILIKLLLKNAIRNLNTIHKNKNNNYKSVIKNHISKALSIIENHKINWEILSILNINEDLINSIKALFQNLLIIKTKSILRYYFHKYKKNTLGYTLYKKKLKKKYIQSETFLKNQLLSLEEGSILIKINYTSDGYNEHFFRICLIDDEYYFCVHKKISDIKPYKIFNLQELNDITIGIKTNNLKNKISDKFMKQFKPGGILSLWFNERTFDLYFDNDDEMNRWFEAIYYYNKYIIGNNTRRNLNYFFFNKLKLKLLFRLKNCQNNNLIIIEQLKYYYELNELEFLDLPFAKCLLLYLKILEKMEEK